MGISAFSSLFPLFPSFEFIPNKSNDRAVDNIDMTSEYIGMYITIKQVSDDEDKRMVSNKPVQSSPGRNTSKKGQIMETMVMRLLVKQERRSKWPSFGCEIAWHTHWCNGEEVLCTFVYRISSLVELAICLDMIISSSNAPYIPWHIPTWARPHRSEVMLFFGSPVNPINRRSIVRDGVGGVKHWYDRCMDDTPWGNVHLSWSLCECGGISGNAVHRQTTSCHSAVTPVVFSNLLV